MNKNALITTAAVFAGLTAIEIANKIRKDRKAALELQKNLKNIHVLYTAHELVMKKIESGEFKDKTYDELLDEYEFYKLVNNPKL